MAFLQTLGPASWDWQERAHKLVWKFKRVQGGADITLKVGPSILRMACCLSQDSRTPIAVMDTYCRSAWQMSGMAVADTGACHPVRSAWSGDQEGCWPNQSAVHSAHVLCIAAASAVPADSERSQEQSALSMGPVCHTVELICDQNMRSRALCRLPVMKYVSLGSESACALIQPNLVAERHVEWGIHGA